MTTRRIWPFRPLSPVIETLEWATDVFMAKSSEQRHALRLRPRRVISYTHILTTIEAHYALSLVRASQANGGFYIPDWTQSDAVGAVGVGGTVSSTSLADIDVTYGDDALVWDSARTYERTQGGIDSNGYYESAALTNAYTQPRIMPLWTGDTPDGVQVEQLGTGKARVTINFIMDSQPDIGASAYSEYRTHPVVDDCPILVGGLDGSLTNNLSTFDNTVTDITYLRLRDIDEKTFLMRWRDKTRRDAYATRTFIASRYGRQKVFWASSFTPDLSATSSISGTTVNVYNDILIRSAPFDIEIRAKDGTSYYRQVSSWVAGTPVNGRPTADLTIDSSVTVSLGDISRISILTCTRFDSDRIEFNHEAGVGVTVAIPCREVPVP